MHLYNYDTLLLPIPHKGHRPNYHSGQPWTTTWFQNDREYLYQANLKRLAPDWYYRDREITYTFNSTGYRAPEFDTVDWANSYVIMGCSYVLGVGVAYEHTLGENLSLIMDAPVINLGVGGGNISIMQYNTALMVDRAIRPRGVFILVPEMTRINYWRDKSWTNLLPSKLEELEGAERSFYRGWLGQEPNAELHSHLALRGLVAEWRAMGVPAHTFTFQRPGNSNLELGPCLPPQQDLARDVEMDGSRMYAHVGRNTLRSWARFIADQTHRPYL